MLEEISLKINNLITHIKKEELIIEKTKILEKDRNIYFDELNK